MGSVIIRKRVLWDPRRWERIFPEWMAEMSPEEDRLLLTWLANHAREPGKKEALRILGVTETPPCPDRELTGWYWVLKEQIEREDDPEIIRTAALNAPTHLAHFARNRITGSRDPSPEQDEWSFMTYECEQLPGITPEYAAEFNLEWEREMLRQILPPGYKLFEPHIRDTWTAENAYMIFEIRDIMKLHPSCDRLLLENLARHSDRLYQRAALGRLEASEPPVPACEPEEERYRILMEQVQRIQSPNYLEETASGKRDDAGRAAFCRLTGYAFRKEGTHTFACRQTEEATPDGVRSFCRRMAKENGPFAEEAAEWLEENDQSGIS